MLRAQVCQRLERHSQALADLKQALSVGKDNSLVREMAGDSHAALNNHKIALQEYSRAIECDGKQREKLLAKKIEMLYKCREYKAVLKECESVLSSMTTSCPQAKTCLRFFATKERV